MIRYLCRALVCMDQWVFPRVLYTVYSKWFITIYVLLSFNSLSIFIGLLLFSHSFLSVVSYLHHWAIHEWSGNYSCRGNLSIHRGDSSGKIYMDQDIMQWRKHKYAAIFRIIFQDQGPFYWQWLNGIMIRIINNVNCFPHDLFTDPYLNFNNG